MDKVLFLFFEVVRRYKVDSVLAPKCFFVRMLFLVEHMPTENSFSMAPVPRTQVSVFASIK
jgi:hypothetical protein